MTVNITGGGKKQEVKKKATALRIYDNFGNRGRRNTVIPNPRLLNMIFGVLAVLRCKLKGRLGFIILLQISRVTALLEKLAISLHLQFCPVFAVTLLDSKGSCPNSR